MSPGHTTLAVFLGVLVIAFGPGARSQPASQPESQSESQSQSESVVVQEQAPEAAPEDHPYALRYEARILPSERSARVSLLLPDHDGLVRSIRFRVDPDRHRGFEGNGELEVREGQVHWTPPPRDAELHYRFRIDHLRDATSYDARCAEQWAIFRGEHLVPPVRVVTQQGATSEARLRLLLPAGWTAALPYEKLGESSFAIEDATRRFDRPKGWLAIGRLGVLRERIAGSRVAIAGPTGQGLRRHDILALLRWTLPELRDVMGELPGRILIVTAGDPMWRGGLSGPASLFIHADRPLISSDLTSPVLHELVHVAMGARSAKDGDWIVEGLAELYSLEMLVRSRSVSRHRYHRALEAFAERGAGARLGGGEASGPVSARAVGVLHDLGEAIERASDGDASLDDVVALLTRRGEPLGTRDLRAVAEEVAGRELGAFFASVR